MWKSKILLLRSTVILRVRVSVRMRDWRWGWAWGWGIDGEGEREDEGLTVRVWGWHPHTLRPHPHHTIQLWNNSILPCPQPISSFHMYTSANPWSSFHSTVTQYNLWSGFLSALTQCDPPGLVFVAPSLSAIPWSLSWKLELLNCWNVENSNLKVE